MSVKESTPALDVNEEVSELIATLHQTGQRLEELTAGEVDTVASRDGRTFVLQSAQEQLRHVEAARQASILNALPAHVALLDTLGLIISVNEAWRRFEGANVLLGPGCGIGLDYIEICERAQGIGSFDAHQVAAGIRSVLKGAVSRFSIEYSSDSPTGQRWFLLIVTPLAVDHPVGAVVMHLDVTARRQAEDSLRISELRFRALIESVTDVITVTGADGVLMYVSPSVKELGGYEPGEMVGRSLLEFLHPDDMLRGMKAVEEVSRSPGRPVRVELRYRHKNGSWLILESVSRNMMHLPEIGGIVVTVHDVTERMRAETAIKRLNRVYAVLSGINTLIVRVRDRDELFKSACQIAVEAGGFSMALIGIVAPGETTIAPVASAGKDEALLAAVKSLLSSRELSSSAMVARAVSGKKAIVSNDSQCDPQVLLGAKYAEAGIRSMVVLPLIVADAAVGALALYSSEKDFFHEDEMKLLTELAGDVAFAIDHLDKQERLNYLAYYDVLTGLANRSLFLERVAQHLRSAASGGRRLALYLIDLERFKNINDSLGQPAGDALLRQVADWLKRILGDTNLLARVGADRFAVVLPEEKQEGDVVRLLETTLKAFLNHPFRLNDAVFRIAAKIGVALYPGDGADADTLFKNAEAALKNAKASGERYLFYAQTMTETVAGRSNLETQLRQALDNGEFVLHYEPKISVASGKLTGAEALIRWNDPRTGLVLPGRFIPILEETGMIHEVGRWALRKAVEDYLRWRAAGLAAVRVAVNVSPRQLRHRGFIGEVEQAIGIDAHAAAGLELEITESLIMEDVKHSVASLRAIRAMGVRIAIDDFGTGFSSLSYLSKLPVDSLKIDRSFVSDMTAAPEGLALVSTIIDLAHSLKLNVVAEGVESEDQSRLLRLLSCDEMQGYLFSKAVPSEIFETRFLAPSPAG